MSEILKARYWWAVCYPENMLPFWEERIDDLVQVPYAYCKHYLDQDSESDHRKDHIHLILVFPNTTTYKHAFNIFDRLSAEGVRCLNKIEACSNIRYCYNYLIHDTNNCRKKNKYLYDKSDRIIGNNFDIGCYEQVNQEEIKRIKREISSFVLDNRIDNYAVLYDKVNSSFDDSFVDVLTSFSAHFERLCKGIYLQNIRYDKFM